MGDNLASQRVCCGLLQRIQRTQIEILEMNGRLPVPLGRLYNAEIDQDHLLLQCSLSSPAITTIIIIEVPFIDFLLYARTLFALFLISVENLICELDVIPIYSCVQVTQLVGSRTKDSTWVFLTTKPALFPLFSGTVYDLSTASDSNLNKGL